MLEPLLNDGIVALRVGGILHFVQVPAMVGLWFTIQRYRLQEQLSATLQRILGVLGGGIVLAVGAGGVLSLTLDPSVLCSSFGVCFAVSWSLFWAYRLAAQVFVYGPVIPLRARFVHWLLSLVFAAKTVAYSFATYVALTH
jgi:hypothetical protein